jgi:hypothetical protein
VISRLASRRQDIVNQANEQEKIAGDEKKRWESYLEELEKSRVLTARDMDKLRELTQGLDKVRKTIRDAIRNNEEYLRRIVSLEAEVLSLKLEVGAKEKAEKDRKKQKLMP